MAKNKKQDEANELELTPEEHAESEERKDRADRAVVLKNFGDGEEYDYHRYLLRAKAAKAAVVDCAFEMGRCLLVIKAHEEHGKFLRAVEEIGVGERMAQVLMRNAKAFGKTSRLKALPQRKLDILAQLSEPEIEALNKGKRVMDIKADELDGMSAQQLREKLRNTNKAHHEFCKNNQAKLDQVKRERDYYKYNSSVTNEFARLSLVASTSLAQVLEMDLHEVDTGSIFWLACKAYNASQKLIRRANPDEFVDVPVRDKHVQLGLAEARQRKELMKFMENEKTDE